MRIRVPRNRPARSVTHDLINKMSVIIGNCDLLREKMDEGTEQSKRVSIIRAIADQAVKELTKDIRKAG
jgi:hypothetical protein